MRIKIITLLLLASFGLLSSQMMHKQKMSMLFRGKNHTFMLGKKRLHQMKKFWHHIVHPNNKRFFVIK